MIKSNVNLKESFVKSRFEENSEILGNIKLSNGKELDVYFLMSKKIIEVTHKRNECMKEPLTAEERVAIIESILKKYTQTCSSILNLSISYEIETFKLADTTNIMNCKEIENNTSKVSILEEYISSSYAEKTDNKVFKAVKYIYDKLPETLEDEKQLEALSQIQIPYNVNFIQLIDVRHYVTILVALKYSQNVDVDISLNTAFISIIKK